MGNQQTQHHQMGFDSLMFVRTHSFSDGVKEARDKLVMTSITRNLGQV